MNQLTKKLIIEIDLIFSHAKLNHLLAFVIGGFAIDFAFGKITRNHGDIDLIVEEKDLKSWEKWFESRGFICEYFKNKSQKNCFIMSKDGVHIDIGGIYFDGENVFDNTDSYERAFLWPIKRKDLFKIGIIQGKEVNYANPELILNFKLLANNKNLRNKDIQDIDLLKDIIYNK